MATTRSFLFSAMDHACNDAKAPLSLVNSRFQEWKKSRMDVTSADEQANEQYIIHYGNKRTEYEEAYKLWKASREDLLQKIKATNIIGEKESLMQELSALPIPDALSRPIPDIYTRYKPNQ